MNPEEKREAQDARPYIKTRDDNVAFSHTICQDCWNDIEEELDKVDELRQRINDVVNADYKTWKELNESIDHVTKLKEEIHEKKKKYKRQKRKSK
jgi:hypothetical protein